MWEALEKPIGRLGREMFKHTSLNMFKRVQTFLLTLAGRGATWQALERPIGRPGRELCHLFKHV